MIPDVASFPDLHHLVYVRDRLWARRPSGRAAVMIGAGFSRNAEPKTAGARPFPLWSQISEAMVDRLRPGLDAKQREKALNDAVSGSGSLTLALEFEATFGRSALDDLIIGSVPDQDHSPGHLHQVLLSLPWADVFTTNYDTLLERTPTSEHNRYYDVVVQSSDLPNATSPRIVKLHGSLPATKPFIITEEDFRRYPRTFAPFVNTVQQSMLENDFVLLGFSGDDPNFLSWLGWVRDELAAVKPRVYLCGVLDLSNARRKVLHERGVTTIDLGYLFPASNYPDNHGQRTQDALTWLLYSLANGQAHQIAEEPLLWPYFPKFSTPGRRHIEPAPLELATKLTYPEPEYRPTARIRGSASEAGEYSPEAVEEITQLIAYWKAVRKLYPGWLVLPQNNRKRLIERTDERGWRTHVFKWAATLPAIDRLEPLYELLWRLERGMLIIDSGTHEELLLTTLRELEIPSSPTQREQWAGIAFFCLQHFRHDYQPKVFYEILAKTEPLADNQPRYGAQRCWQAALHHLEILDVNGAKTWLRKWPEVVSDPVWDLRRAGVWSELGELENAERYLTAALNASVERQPRGQIRVDLLSIESAARLQLLHVRESRWFSSPEDKTDLTSIRAQRRRDRQQLYEAYHCDSGDEMQRLGDVLEQEVPQVQRVVNESINPHTGRRVTTRSFGSSGGFELAWVQPAFDVLAAYELRGKPLWLPSLSNSIIGKAVAWVQEIYPQYAFATLIRLRDRKGLNNLLDKATVLSFDLEALTLLLDNALKVIEQSFASSAGLLKASSRYDNELVGTALILIGRTAFRLTEEYRSRTVQITLSVWQNWPGEYVIQRNLGLNEDDYNAFTQGVLSILTPDEVTEHLAVMLRAASAIPFNIDPFTKLSVTLLPKERPNTSVFNSSVKFCIEELLSTSEYSRSSALIRLLRLKELDWLTPDEIGKFGENLWSRALDEGALPELRHWETSMLLAAPHPPAINVNDRVKRHLLLWLDQLNEALSSENQHIGNGDRLGRFLSTVTHATKPTPDKLVIGLNAERQWLEWSENEAVALFQMLEAWFNRCVAQLEHNLQATRGHRFHIADYSYDNFEPAGQFLRDVVIPRLPSLQDISSRVYELIKSLIKYELRGRTALPFLVDRMLERPDVLEYTNMSIRAALHHPTSAIIVEDGVEALCRWVYRHHVLNYTTPPPENLIKDLLRRLATPELPNLLAVAKWAADIISIVPSAFWPRHAEELGEALTILAQETTSLTWVERNLARSVTALERIYQRPLIREQAARLAAKLYQLNKSEPVEGMQNILANWLEIATNDPLPEVRRAWPCSIEQSSDSE